jgi:hypothetical protein
MPKAQLNMCMQADTCPHSHASTHTVYYFLYFHIHKHMHVLSHLFLITAFKLLRNYILLCKFSSLKALLL